MERLDWLGLAFWIFATYYHISPLNFSNYEWYRSKTSNTRSCLIPPVWVFPLVWNILYGLMSASIFLVWKNSDGHLNELYYDTMMILYGINLLTNKFWTIFFFELKDISLAFIDNIVISITALSMVIILGINEFWIPFGLLFVYPLWCIYTLFLNAYFGFILVNQRIHKRTGVSTKRRIFKQNAI